MKKAALITGSALRIGRAVALFLAESGYDIALHYNSSDNDAAELKNILENKGVFCRLFKADFNDERETFSLIGNVKKEFPHLSLLVNNASVFDKKSILESDAEFFNKVFNINFKAPFFLTKEYVKTFKKGNIINILDTKIAKNDYNYSVYTLSKKALYEFTLMAAKEFGPEVRINAIAPGFILPPEGIEPDYLEKMIKNIPLKAKGSLADITSALGFILNNDYLTGEVLYIDGGQKL